MTAGRSSVCGHSSSASVEFQSVRSRLFALGRCGRSVGGELCTSPCLQTSPGSRQSSVLHLGFHFSKTHHRTIPPARCHFFLFQASWVAVRSAARACKRTSASAAVADHESAISSPSARHPWECPLLSLDRLAFWKARATCGHHRPSSNLPHLPLAPSLAPRTARARPARIGSTRAALSTTPRATARRGR